MPSPSPECLIDHVRRTLPCYDVALLRQVAHRLCRPRNQWPSEELVGRVLAALDNPVILDRRLKELPAACRHVLALVSHSRQPRWPVGALVEMLVTLGHADGLAAVTELLETALLVPELFPVGPEGDESDSPKTRVRSFAQWLTLTTGQPPHVIAPPLASARALGEDLALPECPGAAGAGEGGVLEADGLEWPLRLAVLRQQVAGAPLRRTQQNDFFKRDLERLRGDPQLAAAPDAPAVVPDPGLFTVGLARAVGLLVEGDAELVAGDYSGGWGQGLASVLADLWASLPRVHGWNPVGGWEPGAGPGNPYPSAQLLALLLLGRLPTRDWARAPAIEEWLRARHPFWSGRSDAPLGITSFLLGVAYLLRLVQARRGPEGEWLVRLSPLGRGILGLGPLPPAPPSYPQTLLVQPNLEILAYRQGLTPALIVQLSRFATWKGLGPACTLQLEPHSVYRGLESGETLAGIVQTLDRHGMKGLPSAVTDSLRTWSNKRDRLTVFPSAALFEFATAAELNDALARGLPAQQLTDRLAVVASESEIDFRHFRLTGTRDYCLPPERCVDVEEDGVTLNIDLARSDLLLETELQRFAEPVARTSGSVRRHYRLTPASLASARGLGVTPAFLERWFEQRTGSPLSPAGRLLLSAADTPPPALRRQLVLHVADPQIADGLQQWPATRDLVQVRLGPTALAVAEDDVAALTERLGELAVRLVDGERSQ
jgi:hypothetical protein